MPKFPNHSILKLLQQLRESFFQNFLSQNLQLPIYGYFPENYLKFLITQLFLKIFPKYRKNFLKIACFRSFLTVPLNFLRNVEHMSISSEFRNTWVVRQKLSQLSDTHFSQVLNKMEKNFFHGFIKYHLLSISSKLY